MAQTIIGAIKIKDGLFIGDEYASQDREFIITNKVTHIINCAGTQIANKWAQAGVKYLTFNWLENDQEILFDEKGDNVNKIFGFIEECFHQGESCLVHSVRGQSRSCCVLAAYFMKKFRQKLIIFFFHRYSWTLYKTLEYLNSRRPDLEIRASFFYQLNALESRLAKQGTKRTASWNELTHDDTEAFGQEELIIRNTFLNSHNGPVDEIYTNMQAKLNILNRNPQQKLKWRDIGSKENLAELVYNGSPDFIPISEIIAKELQIQSILKGANKKTKTLVVKPPQGTGNVQKSQQSLSTQSNSQVRSVSSKSQAESQESQQVVNQGQNPISNNSQIQNTNQLTSILQSNPSFNNLLLNCSLKSRTPSQQDNLKKAQPLQNNFMKPPLQSDGGVRSNSLQQNDEKNKAAENQRTNSLKSKESQKELQQQTNSVLTNFQEFKNQVQQSLNYFNKQTESIPPQMKEDSKKQSKLDQLISPTVINSISSTKHSEIQKTLSQSISQLQSSYQKFQQLQMKNQQGMKQSQSTTQIMKEPVQVSEIQQINKTADISNLRKQLEQKNNRPSSAEVKDKSLSKDKKESLSPFSKEVKPMKIQQGPPLPQSSSQLYLRNVQCRRQAASTLRNQQKPNNSFQDKYLNQSANNQQNNSFNNNSNSQIDSENKTQVIKQFAQQTITDLNQFKKLVSPQSLTKSQAQFAKNQPIKVLQELTDKTASQKQVKQKDNISMSFTLQKPAQNTRTFSPVVKVVEGKAKNGNPNIRHKIRNSSPGNQYQKQKKQNFNRHSKGLRLIEFVIECIIQLEELEGLMIFNLYLIYIFYWGGMHLKYAEKKIIKGEKTQQFKERKKKKIQFFYQQEKQHPGHMVGRGFKSFGKEFYQLNQKKNKLFFIHIFYVCKFSVIIGLQASENLFQVNLTQDQAKVIAKSMPSGFSINLLRASKRDATKRIQQDISSEEDSKVKRRPPQPDPYKNQNDEIKKCNSLMAKLKKHPNSSLFLRRLENVNYPADQEYIDLQIVENNLKNNEYQTINQFWADIRRIWQMSYAMNQKGSQVYAMTQEIDQYFTDIYKELDQPVLKQIISNPKQPVKAAQKKQPQSNPKPPIKNKMEEPMTTLEKKQLVNNIKKLPAEHLRGVWEIVSDGLTIQNQSEEIEFDIDTLPVKKTRQLEKYVNSKLQYIDRIQKQAKKQDYDSHTVNSDKILHRMNNVEYLPPKPIVSDIGQLQDSGDSSFSSDNEDDSR